VWKLAQSPKVKEIYAAPGNAGTAQMAHNLGISPTDIESLVKAAKENKIDLTVVGPEAPLANGIADQFLVRGLAIFGSTRAATEIESSKVFAKELMHKYNIPSARSASFSEYAKAKEYVQKQSPPIVIKADGLAAGKGVSIAESVPEALDALSSLMESKALGLSGDRVVIEEYLSGKEMSAFAFTDAHTVVPMVPACDYKRIYDGDQGPNTGGMGSYSPPQFYNPALAKTVTETIMKPTVKAMYEERRPYKGVLYGGLMITNNGPKVLEFNARFGDPEAQVTLPRLKTELVDIMQAVVNNNLDQINIEWSEDACVGVVMASAGYPGNYRTGYPITGLDELDKDILVFHAGTKMGSVPGQVLTSGGRVLTVVATGKTIAEAREKVYKNISRIHFEGCHYRKDIAKIKGRLKGRSPFKKFFFPLSLEGWGGTGSEVENMPLVAVVMGSKSETEALKPTLDTLTQLGIDHEVNVISAHRTPEKARQYGLAAEGRGIEVIIAAAGGVAHLPGVLASWTTLPVIGVPLATSEVGGIDALYSIVQMPAGIPVACVAIGSAGAKNAAYLAAEILGLKYDKIRKAYEKYRSDLQGDNK